MAEHQARTFYLHDRYAATYYAIYVEIEKYIASLVFRNDLSRVFLASDDYAYRRRFELTDTSQSFNDITLAALRFPFANYNPLQTSWVPDTRVAANNASILLSGVTAGTRLLRAMAVEKNLPITFHFDREDDARLAYETLLYTSFTPISVTTTLAWMGEIIEIPILIKLENLQFNPRSTEETWLQENRIFIISGSFKISSNIFLPNRQPDYQASEWAGDNERFTLTEEVILNLFSRKQLQSTLTIDTLFNQNPEIQINQFGVIATTPTTARLQWDIEAPSLATITLILQGRDQVSVDPTKSNYQFRGLVEDSTYIVTAIFTDNAGVSKRVATQFTTPLSAASTRAKTAPKNSLVGTSW